MRHRFLTAAVLAAVLLPASASAKNFSPDLPPEARASLERGQRAIIDQQLDTAAREFERVIELAPDYARVYHLYAHALRGDADRLKTATERYRKLAEGSPDNPVYWYAYGRLEQDVGAREAAFNKVVELAPKEPWGYFGLAYVARVTNKLDKAVPLYEKARALAPDDTSISSGLASAYATAGRKDDARKVAEEVQKAAPGSFEADSAFSSLGPALPENERPAFAERYITLFPSGLAIEQSYWTVLGELAKKDPAAAAARVREAAARLSGSRFAGTRAIMFNEYVIKPTIERGQAAVDKLAGELLLSKETSPEIFLFLGQAYASEKADPAIAIRLLSRGLELLKVTAKSRVEVGEILRYELGRAYLRAGDAARAVELLETVTSGDNYGPAAIAAGQAHLKLGDSAKAYDALARAVAIAPTPAATAALADAAKTTGRTAAEANAAVWAARDSIAKPAADFTLTSLDGKQVSLASYKGKVVLLNFWFPG